MSAGRVFLWTAGPVSGITETRDRAFSLAGEHIGDGGEALVEEAVTVMVDAGSGDLIPGHELTGPAWRGRLQDGEAVWQPDRAAR